MLNTSGTIVDEQANRLNLNIEYISVTFLLQNRISFVCLGSFGSVFPRDSKLALNLSLNIVQTKSSPAAPVLQRVRVRVIAHPHNRPRIGTRVDTKMAAQFLGHAGFTIRQIQPQRTTPGERFRAVVIPRIKRLETWLARVPNVYNLQINARAPGLGYFCADRGRIIFSSIER